MKQLLLAISLLISGQLLAQVFDSSDAVFQLDQVDFIQLETFPHTLCVAGNKKEAITGWMISKSKKELKLYHYNEGVEDGYFAEYNYSKRKYHLKKAGYNKKGRTVQNLHYNPRKQFLDSNNWSYGLVKVRVYNDHFGKDNDFLLYRDIDLESAPYKVLNYHYFYDTKKSKIVRHEEDYIRDIWDPSYSDTIRTHLPFELNANANPFTFMRFDGYYAGIYRKGLEIEGAHMLKFFPNHSVKYQLVEGGNIENPSWEHTPATSFQLVGNTLSVKINGTEVTFKNATFFATFFFAETEYNNPGFTKIDSYQFIKTGRH